jgi:hypothetical protein
VFQPQTQQKPNSDALSAALAAATMVAQKLNKTHGVGGATATPELMNKLPQNPVRSTLMSDTVLSKDSSMKYIIKKL